MLIFRGVEVHFELEHLEWNTLLKLFLLPEPLTAHDGWILHIMISIAFAKSRFRFACHVKEEGLGMALEGVIRFCSLAPSPSLCGTTSTFLSTLQPALNVTHCYILLLPYLSQAMCNPLLMLRSSFPGNLQPALNAAPLLFCCAIVSLSRWLFLAIWCSFCLLAGNPRYEWPCASCLSTRALGSLLAKAPLLGPKANARQHVFWLQETAGSKPPIKINEDTEI